jgi:tetratricopeptide (TPR) repeat protein
MLAVMRGAPDAEAQIFATLELGTAAGQPDAAVAFGSQLTTLRGNQGRLGELAEMMRANVDAMPHLPVWRPLLAWLYTETDQLEQAREQVDILRANGLDPPLNWSWPTSITTLCAAVRDLNDRAAAAVLYELLCPITSQVYVSAGLLTCPGSYAHYCGLLAACLGRWDDAERHFADALAMNERLGARPYVVRTRRAWASMLLDRDAPGDATRARDLIAAGRAEAETLGIERELVRLERLQDRL